MHIFQLPTLEIFLIASSLFIFPVPCIADDPIHYFCSVNGNYTANSTFETNLNHLLPSLLYASSSFYSFTPGEGPERAFAMISCTPGSAGPICANCLATANQEITKFCPFSIDAVIWYEYCMLRYSNESMYGILDTERRVLRYNTRNISQSEIPDIGIAFMYGLISIALSEHSLLVINSSVLRDSERRYGLVRCSPDLSIFQCSMCLNTLMNDSMKGIEGNRGWYIFCPSCQIRYEAYPFIPEALAPGSPVIPETTNAGGRNKEHKVVIIIIIVMAGFGVIIISSSVYYLLRKRKKRIGSPYTDKEYMDVIGGSLVRSEELPIIDFGIIQTATNNFADEKKLGEGGFGPVYKGLLPDGKEIAVKRLSSSSGQGLEEFKNEVMLMAKLQHRNLVRLLNCCLERDEKLLVYEYMSNQSLDFFLYDPTRPVPLDWRCRTNIVSGIARGLLYLHEDSQLRIIHRDLKASNILLDSEMNPKISDFAIARSLGGSQRQGKTTRLVGTYGYMAPEYAMAGQFSVKSDVFSFGVLLLEIISGKRNTDPHIPEHGQSLLAYAWRLWCEGNAIDLMDPLLVGSCVASEVVRWIHIGLLCVQEEAADRPTMSFLVLTLGSDSMTLPQPKRPAFSIGRSITNSDRTSQKAHVLSVNG